MLFSVINFWLMVTKLEEDEFSLAFRLGLMVFTLDYYPDSQVSFRLLYPSYANPAAEVGRDNEKWLSALVAARCLTRCGTVDSPRHCGSDLRCNVQEYSRPEPVNLSATGGARVASHTKLHDSRVDHLFALILSRFQESSFF